MDTVGPARHDLGQQRRSSTSTSASQLHGGGFSGPAAFLLAHTVSTTLSTSSTARTVLLPARTPTSGSFPFDDKEDLVSYSPKHLRRPLASRNMKNLLLNLASGAPASLAPAGGPQGGSIGVSLAPPPAAVPAALSLSPQHSSSSPHDSPKAIVLPSKPWLRQAAQITPGLTTPALTSTPTAPPPVRSNTLLLDSIDAIPSLAQLYPPSHAHSTLYESADDRDRLRSPLMLNPSEFHHYAASPAAATAPASSSSASSSSSSSTLSASSYDLVPQILKKLPVPEELQELNQLNAYPLGPRNVLDNKLFLYLDPNPRAPNKFPNDDVDINSFDLVVNVAKECEDLSLLFANQLVGRREYVHLEWQHTSAISRDLPALVRKIDQFYDAGRRVLVHCQCGVSRSACVVVAYFMYKFGVGVNEGYELLKVGTTETVWDQLESLVYDNSPQRVSSELSVQRPARALENSYASIIKAVAEKGHEIEACDRICPNMSLIFELMEFGDGTVKL